MDEQIMFADILELNSKLICIYYKYWSNIIIVKFLLLIIFWLVSLFWTLHILDDALFVSSIFIVYFCTVKKKFNQKKILFNIKLDYARDFSMSEHSDSSDKICKLYLSAYYMKKDCITV